MKILLIQANDTTFHDGQGWAHKNRRYAYAPTTLTTLAALVPDDLNATIEIVDEGVQVLPRKLDADLIGISVATPNAPRAYEIAVKAGKQGIRVVLGGVHPTLMPDEAKKHADAIVIGQAEETWPRLLLDFKRGSLNRVYQENSTDSFSHSYITPRRELLKRKAYLLTDTIEATRGCLNQCDFCIIPATSKRNFCVRPVAHVVEEVKSLGMKKVVFLDSNPTEIPGYAKQLYQELIPLKISWYGAATFKAIRDKEWLELAVRSGCKGVLIGFESLNRKSLESHGKRFNQIGEFKEAVKRLHRHNIAVLGCFMFGLEEDDPSVFKKTVQFADETAIDLVQYAVNTPFPGTPFFKHLEDEDRILTRDWRYYDGKHTVFKPAKMTPGQLQQGFVKAWKSTYTFRSIAKRLFGSRSQTGLCSVANLGFRFLGTSLDFDYHLSQLN